MIDSYQNAGGARADILLLVGTVTGNAEKVAATALRALAEHGFSARLLDMADALPETLNEFRNVIICTSTWSDGEVPDNAIDLFDALNTLSPDLSHVQYGIIALGDRRYEPHFCGGAAKFDALLSSLSARRAVERYEINAGPTAEDREKAALWAVQCAAAFCAERIPSSPAA